MGKSLTNEEFIKRAILLNGSALNYSNTKYINMTTPIEVVCHIHGVFTQIPLNHIRRKGCPLCNKAEAYFKKRYTTKTFIVKAIKVHGNKYDYSLVKYELCDSKIKIVCPIHGIFEQTPSEHLYGKGCKECGFLKIWDIRGRVNTEEFILKAKILYNTTYNYSMVNYEKSNKKIKIICKEHGIFEQTPNSHLNGYGCPKCATENRKGKNSHFYKDGKSDIRRKERKTQENKKWVKLVKQNQTQCNCCNEPFSEYNIPHAHHLNSWADFPNERYSTSNGITICADCHWEFHSKYGHGFNTKEQYYQFKELKNLELDYG